MMQDEKEKKLMVIFSESIRIFIKYDEIHQQAIIIYGKE